MTQTSTHVVDGGNSKTTAQSRIPARNHDNQNEKAAIDSSQVQLNIYLAGVFRVATHY